MAKMGLIFALVIAYISYRSLVCATSIEKEPLFGYEYRRRLRESVPKRHEMPSKHVYSHPMQTRVEAHFPDMESFLESSKKLEEGPVITCTSYQTSEEAREILLYKFRGVHRIFNDPATDKACFLATHPDTSETESVSSSEERRRKRLLHGQEFLKRVKHKKVPHFTSWHFMHPALKVNPAILRHLFEHDHTFDEVSQMHKEDLWWQYAQGEGASEHVGDTDAMLKRTRHDRRYELLVEFVPAVEGSKSRQAIMDELHDYLHSSANTADLVDIMAEAHPHASELWRQGQECSSGSVFGNDGVDLNYGEENGGATKRMTHRRLLFSEAAEDYYHGFKLMSDHLHGWANRQNERRSLVEGQEPRSQHTAVAMDADGVSGISAGCYVALLAKLALHPEVIGISARPRLTLTNNAAKAIMQSFNASIPVTDGYEASSWPYQAAGLNGSEQVVTIADTGLDTEHCSFAGSASDTGISPITYASFISGDQSYDNSYRKIIQYVAYVDSYDTSTGTGHGTHVAGSSVGSNYDTSNNDYDGMATGAKATFFDMGSYNTGALYTPSVFYDMFKPGVNAGARIFSGSFGYVYNYYSSDSVAIDKYLYEINVDYTVLLSVGNEGQEGFYSAIDPAQAKNAIAVGSTESSFHKSSSYNRDADPDYVPYFSSLGPTFDYRYKPDILMPGQLIASANDYTTCDFAVSQGTSMSCGLSGGIAAIIRQFYVDDNFAYARNLRISSSADSPTPSGALIKASLIHSGSQMKKYNVVYSSSPQATVLQNDLELSGRRAGYSAGFNEDPMDSDAIGRSAHRPDFVQGFGRVDLQNLIPLEGEGMREATRGYDLHAWDKYTIGSLETRYFWVTTTAEVNTSFVAHGLKASLVWMDKSNIYVAEKFLLHDLDLIVEKVAFNGSCEKNRPSLSNPVWFGNGGSEPDTHNNVEMIHIPADALEPLTTYRVLVRAKVLDGEGSLNSVDQPYALVLTVPKNSSVNSEVESDFSCDTYRTSGDDDNSHAQWPDYWRISACNNETHLEVELHLTSHDGNGWGATGYYEILDSNNQVVKSGGMNSSDTMSAIREKVTVCLPEGTYSVNLANTGSESALHNQGLLSPMCKMNLHGLWQTSMQMTVAPTVTQESDDGTTGIIPVFKCNECSADQVEVDLMLWSSLYGGKISYGWHTDTSYKIQRTCTLGENPGTYSIATNAPNAGIMEHHKYCLPDGVYDIGYYSISADDDFASLGVYDSSFSSLYGVEEYEIDVYFDHVYEGSIDSYYCASSTCYAYSTPHYERYQLLTGSTNNCTSSGDDSQGVSLISVILYVLLITAITSAFCYCIFRCFIAEKVRARGDGRDGDVHQPAAADAHIGPHGYHDRQMFVGRTRGQFGQPTMMHPAGANAPQYVEVQAVPVMAAPVFVDDSHIQLTHWTEDNSRSLPTYGESLQPIDHELEATEEASLSATRVNQVSPERNMD